MTTTFGWAPTAAGSELLHWHRTDDPTLTIQPTFENEMFLVRNVPVLGTIGGSMDQEGGTNLQPSLTPFPEGRVAFADGSDDYIQSSEAESGYKPLHDGTGVELWFVFRVPYLPSEPEYMMGTGGDVNTQHGIAVYLTDTGDLGIQVANGSGAFVHNVETPGTAISAGTTHVVRIELNATHLIVDVDGTEEINQAHTGSPSSSDPQHTFSVFRETDDYFKGWIPEVIIYGGTSSIARKLLTQTHFSRWTMALTDTSSYELWDRLFSFEEWIDAGSGVTGNPVTAWAGRRGRHTSTGVTNTPDFSAADADLNNEASVTFVRATGENVQFDTLAPLLHGVDRRISLIAVAKVDTSTNTQHCCTFNTSGDEAIMFTLKKSSAPNWAGRKDDGTLDKTITGASADTNAHVQALCTAGSGSSSDLYLDAERSVENGDLDVNTIAMDQMHVGSENVAATVNAWNGPVASLLFFRKRLNFGEVAAWSELLATRYGIALG